MLRLGQIVAYLSEDSPRKKFKPWWEDVADYLTHALLIIATLSWTFLLQDHTSGISCILEDPRTSKIFNNLYAKFFSQKCALEMFDGCFAYFPYQAFFQWMMFFFCQIFWLKLPPIISKVETVHQILEMLDQTSKENNEAERARPSENMSYSASDAKSLENHVKVRLHFLLQEKGITISTVYAFKSLVTVCLAATLLTLMSHHFPTWTELWEKQNVSYNITLLHGNQGVRELHLFCNLGCGRITFVLMCLSTCILSSFIIMSLIGYALLLCKGKNVKKSLNYRQWIKFYPALEDMCIIIDLINAKKQYNYILMEKLRCTLETLVSNRVDNETLEKICKE